jgi:hypothetical protein
MSDPEPAIESLVEIAKKLPALRDGISRSLRRPAVIGSLQSHHEPYLTSFPEVLKEIVDTPGLDADLVSAARANLEDSAS